MGTHYISGWRIEIERREGVARLVAASALARAVAAALEAAGAPNPASAGVILSDDDELAELNAVHMGKDGATDVLSFPLLAPEAYPDHPGKGSGAALDPLAADPADFALPPGASPNLGDIVVSVERAIEQAEAGRGGQTGDVRWDARDELRLLVTHGALHLCGWDHADPVEEAAMRQLERHLLDRA
jgi:probable rRNA maturation factor